MLFRETVTVYYEIHGQMRCVWRSAVGLSYVTADDRPTQSNKWALNGYVTSLFEMMVCLFVGSSVESHKP